MEQFLTFELDKDNVKVKKILNKEFLDLDIYAISDIYPNRNKSAFTLSSLEQSKHTCYNKPILGAFNYLTNDFDQHNGEMKYDNELDNVYWDTSSSNDEKPLGLIRESDQIDIVEKDGLHWLKISCALWTQYGYKQMKRLLKSPTKKVSVEILVEESHYDEDGIQIIDKFILTGITILGDKISEGIPDAHLTIVELMKNDAFSQQLNTLSFAYNNKYNKTNINPESKTGLYNTNTNKLEGKTLTYAEKMAYLTSKLSETCQECYICDFSENFIVVYSYSDGKYYKIPYAIQENEDNKEVSFDFEAKIEQIPTFKDMAREFVMVNDEQKNIDELYSMYQEEQTKNADLQSKIEKCEQEASKIYSIQIDEVEYNVESLYAKYNEDIQNKTEECGKLSAELNEKIDECGKLSADLEALKSQMADEAAEKLACDGKQLAEDEDDLDDDDRKEIEKKCESRQYTSIEEVENDIARALYQKKKNNRSKNFKTNAGFKVTEPDNRSVFDKL